MEKPKNSKSKHKLTLVSYWRFQRSGVLPQKFGGKPPKEYKMRNYKNTMANCGLQDLGFIGSKYTWFNKRKSYPILERLDRAWAYDKWMFNFPDAFVHNLPRLSSDHNPLLINLKKSNHTNNTRYFKFEPMWLENPPFDPWVRENWAAKTNKFVDKHQVLSTEIPVWVNKEDNIF